jgi:hypothetical protein
MSEENTLRLTEETIKGFIADAVLKSFLSGGKSEITEIAKNSYDMGCTIAFKDKEVADVTES